MYKMRKNKSERDKHEQNKRKKYAERQKTQGCKNMRTAKGKRAYFKIEKVFSNN